METIGKIGFVGIGAIGRPIVQRMLDAGATAVVHDIRRESCEGLAGAVEIAESAAALALRADVVFGCLPTIEAYRDAVLGDRGLIGGGRARTYVHIGTTGPALVAELAEELHRRGIATLDAPITGGTGRARAGTLTAIASGSDTALSAARPAIDTYATWLVRIGTEPGMAQTVKLINNMVSATNLAIACEGLAMAARAGLDPAAVIDVLNAGTGQNSATLTKIPDHVLPRSFDYGGRMHITLKDLGCYVEEAERLGAKRGIAEVVRSCYVAAAERLGADTDMTDVMRFIEDATDAA